MGTIERVSFSMAAVTVNLGHRQAVAQLVKRHFGLTYNEFCTLLLLYHALEPLSLAQIHTYLLLARKTALTILTSLEDRGLVAKRPLASDLRRMTLETTSQGRTMAQQALELLDVMFNTLLCSNLPAEEFARFMNEQVIRASLDALRGSPATLPLKEQAAPFYTVEHLIYWRAMSDGWSRVCREAAGLSFTEFGILALLDERGAMPGSDLAEALMVHRSEVSACKRRLLAESLLKEGTNPADSRSRLLWATSKGRRAMRRAKQALWTFTDGVDTSPDNTTAAIINTWYARMYLNVRSSREALREI